MPPPHLGFLRPLPMGHRPAVPLPTTAACVEFVPVRTLKDGSSKHGNALRAAIDSNWVDAITLVWLLASAAQHDTVQPQQGMAGQGMQHFPAPSHLHMPLHGIHISADLAADGALIWCTQQLQGVGK
jgi:hypothetical protein